MANSSYALGLWRVVRAALVFGITTFAACVTSRALMSSLRSDLWRSQWGDYAIIILPAVAVISATVALLDIGSLGAFGSEPAIDFRDGFSRFMFRHVLFMFGFLAPQALMAYEHQISGVFVAVSLLCVFPMVAISEGTSKVIADKAEETNMSDFVKGIGATKRGHESKGIRRD